MKQKKRYLKITALFLAVIWISFACDKLDKLTQFSLEYNEKITIPAVLGLNLPFNIWTPNINTNTEEIFEINDTRKNLIEEVYLEELSLTIVDPADSDFSFLKSIEIFIESDSTSEVLTAWKYEIDNEIGATISMEVSGEDLIEYLIADNFTLRVSSVTDEIPLTDHEIVINARFFVNAKILGI